MRMTDEQLVAYIDSELDPAATEAMRREVEANPALGQRIRGQEALRERLRRAFDRTLDEPVPERLMRAIAVDRVVDLPKPVPRRMVRMAWLGGLAAAAGIVLGIALAPSLTHLVLPQPDIVAGPAGLTASGQLAAVLSKRLASEQPTDSHIQLGASFLAKTGAYCRTFVMGQPNGALSGMACREDGSWALRALHEDAPRHGETGEYRQAATAMSPFVLQAAGAIMSGGALDAREEAAARNHGWQERTAPR